MSYANGIGNLPQLPSSIAPATDRASLQAASPVETANQRESAIPKADRIDQATLSSTGGLISQALEGSDVRSARVSALQQAIADGSYSVSSANVADKLIQSLLGQG